MLETEIMDHSALDLSLVCRPWASFHAPYRVIMCKCRKRDVDAFLAAIRELPNKMLLCGYPDYLTFCADLKKNVQTVRDNGGVLTNETDDTTQEAEQESAKGATCEAAR